MAEGDRNYNSYGVVPISNNIIALLVLKRPLVKRQAHAYYTLRLVTQGCVQQRMRKLERKFSIETLQVQLYSVYGWLYKLVIHRILFFLVPNKLTFHFDTGFFLDLRHLISLWRDILFVGICHPLYFVPATKAVFFWQFSSLSLFSFRFAYVGIFSARQTSLLSMYVFTKLWIQSNQPYLKRIKLVSNRGRKKVKMGEEYKKPADM